MPRKSAAATATLDPSVEAIARTLPLGSVGYENQINERGERRIWLEAAMVDLLFPLSATVLLSARRG